VADEDADAAVLVVIPALERAGQARSFFAKTERERELTGQLALALPLGYSLALRGGVDDDGGRDGRRHEDDLLHYCCAPADVVVFARAARFACSSLKSASL